MAGRTTMKQKKKAAMRRRRRRRFLFRLVLLCMLIIWGISQAVFHRYVSRYPEQKICKNIFIGPVDVSGMTEKEALEALNSHLEEDRKVKAALKVSGQSAETTLEELGAGFEDLKTSVRKAVDYGKKGSLFSRYRKLKKLSKEKVIIEKKIVLDKEKTQTVLEEKAVPLADHAVDATLIRNNGSFEIQKEQEGHTVDVEKSISALQEYLNEEWDHKDFSVDMVLKKEQPAVKAADLETVTDELGTFSTDAGYGERWKNLKAGAERLNGTVLMPGQEVSAHDLTAPYDEEHGYVPAGSYENGQVVDTYGGGICQVTTTLYNALLFAEVEITKRYPHSMLVSYVDPSRDAAIAGDTKDLRFKNNYDTPIYIAGEIGSDNRLRFTIYGKDTRPEGHEVEYESETTGTVEYETTYKADPEASIGSMNVTGSPHTGKSARLWKIVYENGKEVSRDVINESHYNKSDQVIAVGTKSDNPEASKLVGNAVATQDEEKIKAAIVEAKSL